MFMVQRRGQLYSGLLLLLIFGVILSLYTGKLSSSALADDVKWIECGEKCAGENVFTVQLMLLARNYPASMNGTFDTSTTTAVQSLQTSARVKVDGVVNQATWPTLLIQTHRGDRGPAVVALQRQLAAHGIEVIPTGEFDISTEAALRAYQSMNDLSVDGVANLRSWSSLVTAPGNTQLDPPPAYATGPTIWGIDTAPPLTSGAITRIIKKFGQPAFVGKYLHGKHFTALSANEAALLHQRNMKIMLLEPDFGKDTGRTAAESLAKRAIARANELGVPQGVVIFADIEPGSKVDADWLGTWYEVISDAGFVPGYYGNPYPDRNFNGPFCKAVKANPDIASKAILDIYQPMLVRTPAAKAPLFAPSIPYCGKHPTGNVLLWQYGLSRGDREANIDTDIMKASVPLW
ncbi:MAG TPA: peptidoglycan-binding protein [Ktedonobacteraceae bacterium]|nr:peptidoglycan-binding protein [Ktedonobacteraceae bacterium]